MWLNTWDYDDHVLDRYFPKKKLQNGGIFFKMATIPQSPESLYSVKCKKETKYVCIPIKTTDCSN